MFGFFKNTPPTQKLDDATRRLVLALIWSLKPSDLSVLFGALTTEDKSLIGTTRRSAHNIFWQKLVSLGLATEQDMATELGNNLTSFYIHPTIKDEIHKCYYFAINTGYPPRDCAFSNEAIKMLSQYSEEGIPQSQGKLGALYYEGIFVEKNTEKGLQLFSLAAKNGDLVTLNNLAVMYASGTGVEKNMELALAYFLQGAEKGSVGAMENLGEIYARGMGVEENPTTAFNWFKLAAERGHPVARIKLAICYKQGFGVKQDYAEMYVWAASVAEDPNAQILKEDAAVHLDRPTIEQLNLRVRQILQLA